MHELGTKCEGFFSLFFFFSELATVCVCVGGGVGTSTGPFVGLGESLALSDSVVPVFIFVRAGPPGRVVRG